MAALCRSASVLLLRSRSGVRAAATYKRTFSASSEPVGFIGLGNMGLPMALNLIKSGHRVVVFDPVSSAVDAAISAGADAADSAAAVAGRVRTLVTMLPAGRNVMECYQGEKGVFSSLTEDNLLIDSSTIERDTARQVGTRASELGASFLDAPVSGGTGAAQNALLTFMVGGEEVAFARAQPLLACMGKNVIHCGSLGAGQATKICNNMLLGISMIGVSEALQLGRSLGLDPQRLSGAINVASGRCWSSDTYNPCPGVMEKTPASNGYKGGFGTPLMSKDLGLALDAANSTKTATPMGALANQIYQLMLAHGHADKDFSSVFKFLEKQSSE